MAKYFITGAAGFIGLELCKHLTEAGDEVIGLIHKNVPPELKNYPIKLIYADILDGDTYEEHIKDCDYIVHLAGNPKFGNGPEYETQNHTATKILIDIAKKTSNTIKRLIFISTIGAIDRAPADKCIHALNEDSVAYPSSDYGKSKLMAEEYLIKSGLPYTIIRPSLVIGAKMRFASHVAVFSRNALQKSLFARINWPGEISVIHVTDIALAIKKVSIEDRAKNEIYFTAGENISIGKVIKMANPGLIQINIGLVAYLLRPFSRLLPFALKVLLYPALTAKDEKLKSIGWKCTITATEGVNEVIHREKARVNVKYNPYGWTLITGAASGLGKELALRLQEKGRNLILIDKDKDALEKLPINTSQSKKIVCDLSDWEETHKKLNEILTTEILNNICELFLSAGFGLRGDISKLGQKSQADILKVNTLSRLYLATEFLPSMINNQFGRIVLISSSSAFQPLPYMGVYSASNAAVLFLGESLAYENKKDGIEVKVVCPGGMATNFQKSAGVKEVEGEVLMTPGEVADIIMSSIGSRKLVLMTAFRSFAMSMLARFLPRKLSLSLWGKLMKLAR